MKDNHNLIRDYNNLIFRPIYDTATIDLDFNLWSGFQATLLSLEETKAKKDNIKMILNHIRDVWANHNEEYYFYMLNWFHRALKFPHKKNKVALVLRSEKQQIGKGAIVEDFLIPLVYGKNLSIYGEGLNFLTEKFNFHLSNKCLVAVDEMTTIKGDYHSTFDTLKSYITSNNIQIEIKGGKRFQAEQYMNFIMMTNNEYSLKIEKYDNRYAVFECSCEKFGNYEYFNNLYSCFTQENADIFYSYMFWLDELEPEHIVELRNIPETELKRNMRISCLPSSQRFIYHVYDVIVLSSLSEHITPEILEIYRNEKMIKSSVLYQWYNKYCTDENEKPLTNTKFGRDVQNMIEKIRRKDGFYYRLDNIRLD